ncbi:MAG: hypothetical protein KF773_21950 [Deltaproteobacteria bacterium]|nr:hypothetical protein [Deltaproteobacteria bacterium]MCW5802028.1 hypothetical protein [Deltaproteobacteria bacterium]
MKIRVLFCAALASQAIGCGKGAGGKLAVDTPMLPYVAPDIDEITGIDPDEPPKTPTPMPEPAAAPVTPASDKQPVAAPPPPAKKP